MTNEEKILQSLETINVRLDKMDGTIDAISSNTVVLIEAEFKPKFDLLAEGQQTILEGMPSKDDLDIMDGRESQLLRQLLRNSPERWRPSKRPPRHHNYQRAIVQSLRGRCDGLSHPGRRRRRQWRRLQLARHTDEMACFRSHASRHNNYTSISKTTSKHAAAAL